LPPGLLERWVGEFLQTGSVLGSTGSLIDAEPVEKGGKEADDPLPDALTEEPRRAELLDGVRAA